MNETPLPGPAQRGRAGIPGGSRARPTRPQPRGFRQRGEFKEVLPAPGARTRRPGEGPGRCKARGGSRMQPPKPWRSLRHLLPPPTPACASSPEASPWDSPRRLARAADAAPGPSPGAPRGGPEQRWALPVGGGPLGSGSWAHRAAAWVASETPANPAGAGWASARACVCPGVDSRTPQGRCESLGRGGVWRVQAAWRTSGGGGPNESGDSAHGAPGKTTRPSPRPTPRSAGGPRRLDSPEPPLPHL